MKLLRSDMAALTYEHFRQIDRFQGLALRPNDASELRLERVRPGVRLIVETLLKRAAPSEWSHGHS